jgi:hypothetical protein
VATAHFGTGSAQQQAVRGAWEEVGITVSAPHPPARRKKSSRAVTAANGNGAELKKHLQKLSDVLRETIGAMP